MTEFHNFSQISQFRPNFTFLEYLELGQFRNFCDVFIYIYILTCVMAGGGKLLGVSWAGSSLCGSTLPTLDCQGRGQQGGEQRQESHAQPPRTPHSTRLVPTNGVSGGQECPPMYQHLSQHSLGSPLVFLLQMSPSSREKLSFRFCPGKMWARQHHASLLHFPSHDDD